MFDAHLHTHTEHSALDGLGKIEDLILKAKKLGQKAIAITDHGSTSGLYEAYKLSAKHDFKVLYGSEFYFENIGDSRKAGHIILIAKNNVGLSNIYKLQSIAYTEHFYYKPRINLDLLREYGEGIICLSACMANQIAQYILAGENVLAMSHMYELKKIFQDDFYIELQSSRLEDQIKINKVYAGWVEDGMVKSVITNDVHYVDEEDYIAHETLLAIQQNKKMSDPKRWKFDKNDYWLKSEEEMLKELPYISQKVIDASFAGITEIIDKCNVTMESGNYLPSFVHEGKQLTLQEEETMLEDLTMERYMGRITDRKENNKEFFADVTNELSVIKETGYCGYFLIVQEYANWAKDNGLLIGDGRGSGAGSKVAYTNGITEINPQKYNLLFERFLSVGREPDFDIDFSNIDAVFRHLQDVYGKDNVARVGATNRMTAKSAIRKVLGINSFPQSEISKIVGYLPKRLQFTLAEAMHESKDLVKFFDTHKDLYYVVQKLENKLGHMSTHAGGVIICPNLTYMLPTTVNSAEKDKLIISLDKKALEELGHYKFDILGLNSLITLDLIMSSIKDEIDWSKIGLEDQKVYDMLCKGDVLGVFQLAEQADKVTEQQPRCFEDLIAINALIRPGVGDWNEYIKRRKTNFIDSRGLTYLDSTSGIIVYQEQYLLLARTYAGWGIAYSDKYIRKNKDIRNDLTLDIKFATDSVANGYSLQEADAVWEEIVKIVEAGYGFNRSHSASYARLSYQTAYLKCYYPNEFYAGLLTMDGDDKHELMKIKSALDESGIKLLPPDINSSSDEFVPCDGGIQYRLNSINNVGGSALTEIRRIAPIESLEDFMKRRTPKFIKINSIENLIKSGCFDFENPNRYEMLCKLSELSTSAGEYKDQPNYLYEKESLSIYLSDAPYNKYSTKDYNEFAEGSIMSTVGEVTEVSAIYDKNGGEMAFVNIVNKHGVVKNVFFTKFWTQKGVKEAVTIGAMLMITGKKDRGSLLVNKIEVLD